MASISASLRLTDLSPSQSNLVPTNNLLQSLGALSSICIIHFSIFWKDFWSVRENARSIPEAPRQQAWVIFLNLYCPAVSQICSLMVFPSCQITLDLKSTPMVAVYEEMKRWSVNLVIRDVLPTPPSPITSTLARQSLSFFHSVTLPLFL